MKLNINTDAVVKFTNTLEKLHRSALPVAVRTSLNSAAFDVKKRTLLKETSESFTIRQKNFFKANSRVEQAQGFNMNTMRATIGMVEGGLKGGNNYAVKDLEQQERGGSIKGKSFIPLSPARVGGSNAKAVRPQNRLNAIQNVVNYKNAKGANDKQRFVKSVHHAGVGGHVIGKVKNKEILWRVNSLSKTEGGNFKLTALYSYKEKRSVKVNNRNFMEKSATESGRSIEKFFILEAKKQIAKYADR
jgi:hypothetical protein